MANSPSPVAAGVTRQCCRPTLRLVQGGRSNSHAEERPSLSPSALQYAAPAAGNAALEGIARFMQDYWLEGDLSGAPSLAGILDALVYLAAWSGDRGGLRVLAAKASAHVGRRVSVEAMECAAELSGSYVSNDDENGPAEVWRSRNRATAAADPRYRDQTA